MTPTILAIGAAILTFFPSTDIGAPGDGLGLAEMPTVSSHLAPQPARPSPPGRDPVTPFGVALGVAGLTLAAVRSRVRRDDEPLFVVVHGNGGSRDDFDGLIDLMGVEESRVVAFDYRFAASGPSSTAVSRSVDTDTAAAALDEFLRELSSEYSNVYSIHHSKGAAAGVVTIAALDDGSRPPIDGYRGAALLDPPIAAWPLGPLQRLGRPIGLLPDNGGFDPIRCDDDGCRDIREHLGEASGVEVIAIRNPDAEITNFTDEPDGLRVYDLAYDGKPTAWALLWNPFAFLARVFEAHSSVLRHPAVAECIVDEASDPGSCDWKGSPKERTGMWGRGNGANLVR
jgi:pimeloyl-ACP methyl ester carboxylesterase